MSLVKIKKQKTKKVDHKKKSLNFKIINYLEGTQIEDKAKHVEKNNKTDIDSLKQDHNEFIKSRKLMLKNTAVIYKWKTQYFYWRN